MITSPAGLGIESDSAGHALQQSYGLITDPPSRQRGHFTSRRKPHMSEIIILTNSVEMSNIREATSFAVTR
jgi:hypothetical protein